MRATSVELARPENLESTASHVLFGSIRGQKVMRSPYRTSPCHT